MRTHPVRIIVKVLRRHTPMSHMVIRETVLLGDPRLRATAEPIHDYEKELRPVLEDLKDTLTEHQRVYKMGRGLAAPQIGHNKRVVYVQT